MPTPMKRDTLREYARMGAMRRLEELRQELSAIRKAFPELFRGGRPAAADGAAASGARARAGGRRRPKMTAAQRKAVSERMRKYWAARRKAKAKNG